jgi:hypothetical protein
MTRTILIATLTLLALPPVSLAQSNIDPVLKYAWGENIGWTNWRDAEGGGRGVNVNDAAGFLSGYIWGENVGWIHTGDGSGPYTNLDGADFGVNIGAGGVLDGYAWAENVGWINFGTEPFIGGQGARYDATLARFTGYAWGENIGWINLDDASSFVAVSDCPADLTGSGAVDAADLAALIASWGQPGPADLDNSGAVGASDLAALIAAWGPCS